MNISDIQFLFDYNYWANQLMLSHAVKLSPEQLTEPTGFPWGSVHGTLVHIMDAENLWRQLCKTQVVPAQRLPEIQTFPTLESIVTHWKTEENEMWIYLNSLQDSDMESILRYEIVGGTRERVLWHCLVHLVNHGTQHRSECAEMLTRFGHSPDDLDMTRFLNIRAGIE